MGWEYYTLSSRTLDKYSQPSDGVLGILEKVHSDILAG